MTLRQRWAAERFPHEFSIVITTVSLRSTSHLLVIMMLLASGRLLACGLECLDELATPEVASCHTESAPATAISGEASHACLPDVAEPRLTVAKTVKAQELGAAPLVTALITPARDLTSSGAPLHPHHLRHESPHLAALSVLRI